MVNTALITSISRGPIKIFRSRSFCKDVEEKYRSGCETLFYTPEVYRRVRHLTAGRHGFIIPGVLSKTDVLIACELKTAVIGEIFGHFGFGFMWILLSSIFRNVVEARMDFDYLCHV